MIGQGSSAVVILLNICDSLMWCETNLKNVHDIHSNSSIISLTLESTLTLDSKFTLLYAANLNLRKNALVENIEITPALKYENHIS